MKIRFAAGIALIAALLAPEAYTGLAATSAREAAGGAPPAAGNRP